MNVALIAAAGIGKRMGDQGKQYLLLKGKPMLAYTLLAFQNCSAIQRIIIVANKEDLNRCQDLVSQYEISKVFRIVEGGKERQDSVYNGLQVLPEGTKVIAVHDGARPLIFPDLIESSLSRLKGWDGVVVGVPTKDTLKLVKGEKVIETLNRQGVWQIQSPQVFFVDLLIKAYQEAHKEGFYGTDDAVLMERMGYKIRIIMGSYENIKITTPEDVVVAEAILARREKVSMSDER
jgi:2-C-methyl-D-erythritol 4-phosphate cytidylyltransferase